ncbi:putative isoleucyl-tRNA synthetase [Neospora caninum Liverpool]|uniref:Isoleucyl-tRNA synthetase, putative n=1 Tax=Neospora caninum (strain Liverpool) TaxID=572307 RepID=F0VRT4_NEOCL|nr:putative isoleucyl-tRNA synthetase [Neospora caninum Liverpool]CBZ56432.1 putative isoleucyl-tRNA synthetase [Neospora caninum Liverpool]CEL71191.1 TPA: isoleucyl-tRNA synthetase, putative [Neospora caninum Liverpool]|eukprot:XP_003886457.1 putative isoleucyl-tRNA synthetase [Neospora caninum Liverpool]
MATGPSLRWPGPLCFPRKQTVAAACVFRPSLRPFLLLSLLLILLFEGNVCDSLSHRPGGLSGPPAFTSTSACFTDLPASPPSALVGRRDDVRSPPTQSSPAWSLHGWRRDSDRADSRRQLPRRQGSPAQPRVPPTSPETAGGEELEKGDGDCVFVLKGPRQKHRGQQRSFVSARRRGAPGERERVARHAARKQESEKRPTGSAQLSSLSPFFLASCSRLRAEASFASPASEHATAPCPSHRWNCPPASVATRSVAGWSPACGAPLSRRQLFGGFKQTQAVGRGDPHVSFALRLEPKPTLEAFSRQSHGPRRLEKRLGGDLRSQRLSGTARQGTAGERWLSAEHPPGLPCHPGDGQKTFERCGTLHAPGDARAASGARHEGSEETRAPLSPNPRPTGPRQEGQERQRTLELLKPRVLADQAACSNGVPEREESAVSTTQKAALGGGNQERRSLETTARGKGHVHSVQSPGTAASKATVKGEGCAAPGGRDAGARTKTKATAPYTDTVLLPVTKFRLKSNNLRTEAALQRLWKTHNVYERLLRRIFLDGRGPARGENVGDGDARDARHAGEGGDSEESPRCRCGLCTILAFDASHQPSPLMPAVGPTHLESEASVSEKAAGSDAPSSPPSRTSSPPSASSALPPVPVYLLLDGPPYANGEAHMGHALNKTLKDFVTRFFLLRRRCMHMLPGWDCHGLPIELKALERLQRETRQERAGEQREREGRRGAEKRQVNVNDMRQEARRVAEESIRSQKRDFQRFGVWAHWDMPYLTFDRTYEATELQMFRRMWQKGFVYEGVRPVYWSPSSRTALADAEVEHLPRVSRSLYCAFPLVDLVFSASPLAGERDREDRRRSGSRPRARVATPRTPASAKDRMKLASEDQKERSAEELLASAFPSFVPSEDFAREQAGSCPAQSSAVAREPVSGSGAGLGELPVDEADGKSQLRRKGGETEETSTADESVQAKQLPIRVSLLIWTTTPYTLPANQAVAIHGEKPYAVVEIYRPAGGDATRERSASLASPSRSTASPPACALGESREESRVQFRAREEAAGEDAVVAASGPLKQLPSSPGRSSPSTGRATAFNHGGEAKPGCETNASEDGERAGAEWHTRDIWIVAEEAVQRTMKTLSVAPAGDANAATRAFASAACAGADGVAQHLGAERTPSAEDDAPSWARGRRVGAETEKPRTETTRAKAFFRVLGKIRGKDLVGRRYTHPIFPDKEREVILGDPLVCEQKGTGLVHVAPGHGFEDFVLVRDLLYRQGGGHSGSETAARDASENTPALGLRGGSSGGKATAGSSGGKATAESGATRSSLPKSEDIDVGMQRKSPREQSLSVCDLEIFHSPVDEAGRFTREVGVDELCGLDVFGEGERRVIQLLRKRGVLFQEIPFPHLYPHDWRTKQPLICRTTSQVFLRLDRLRSAALERIKQVHFLPYSGQTTASASASDSGACVPFFPSSAYIRMRAALESRQGDWCLSRQRQWGLPLPFFRLKAAVGSAARRVAPGSTGRSEPGQRGNEEDRANGPGPLLGSPETFAFIANKIQEEGSDAWWANEQLEAWLPAHNSTHVSKCFFTLVHLPVLLFPARSLAADLEPARDTFDVWFDAGCAWRGAVDFVRRWVRETETGENEGGKRSHEDERPGDGGARRARTRDGDHVNPGARSQSDGGPPAKQRGDVPIKTLVMEGTDQHRGWFQALLLTHAALASSARMQETAKVADLVGTSTTTNQRAAGESERESEGGMRRAKRRRGAQEGDKEDEEEGGEMETVVDGETGEMPDRPFDVVVTHGFVLDAKGRKMSKSLGNVFSPQLFFPSPESAPARTGSSSRSSASTAPARLPSARSSLDPASSSRDRDAASTVCSRESPDSRPCLPSVELPYYGADVLRLLIAASNYGRDLLLHVPEHAGLSSPAPAIAKERRRAATSNSLSSSPGGTAAHVESGNRREETRGMRGARGASRKAAAGTPLDQAASAYGKLRGTFRFLLGNLQGFHPKRDAVCYDQLPFLDRAFLRRLDECVAQTTQAYELFDFSRAMRGVLAFLADPFSSFYLEVAKDRLYVSARTSVRRRACQTVLAAVFLALAKLLAPVVPHLAEEAFLRLPPALRNHTHALDTKGGGRSSGEKPPQRTRPVSPADETGSNADEKKGETLESSETGMPGSAGGKLGERAPFVSLFETGWPQLRLRRPASLVPLGSPTGATKHRGAAEQGRDSSQAGEGNPQEARGSLEGDEETALWRALVQLRSDANRLLELPRETNAIARVAEANKESDRGDGCLASGHENGQEGEKTTKGQRPTRGRSDAVRTRCDGKLRIITTDPLLYRRLLAFSSLAPLLGSSEGQRLQGSAGEERNEREGLEGREGDLGDEAQKGKQIDEQATRVWKPYIPARAQAESAQETYSETNVQTPERQGTIHFVPDVDDLRWILQFSHVDVVLRPPELGGHVEKPDRFNEQHEGREEHPVAVLPFEASASGTVRLELFLASGQRCSRCWMRSPLVQRVKATVPSQTSDLTASASVETLSVSKHGEEDAVTPRLCPRCEHAIAANQRDEAKGSGAAREP